VNLASHVSSTVSATGPTLKVSERLKIWIVAIALIAGGVANNTASQKPEVSAPTESKPQARPVTVEDAIRMAVVTSNADFDWSDTSGVAHFSPDGAQFVLVEKRGNIERNTNEYSMLLFDTRDVTEPSRVASKVLFTLSSSSSRPAMQQVKWIDNDTIAFLGENPGETQQLYTVNCHTGRLTRLTSHATSLVLYAITKDGNRIFFIADELPLSYLTDKSAREGIAVRKQMLPDLVSEQSRLQSRFSLELFETERNSRAEKRIKTTGALAYGALYPSPDGRYLILKTNPIDPPSEWAQYENAYLRSLMHLRVKGEPLNVDEFEIVDISSGHSRPLLNSPLDMVGGAYAGVVWAPDSNSVVVTGTFLPLDTGEAREKRIRRSKRFVAEIKTPSLTIVPVTTEELKVIRWDSVTGRVLFQQRLGGSNSIGNQGGATVAFEKTDAGWRRAEVNESERNARDPIQVTLEQDSNTPPRVFVRNPRTGDKSLLFDPNPQFEGLAFGHVDEITFRSQQGKVETAGLYFPLGYVAGKKYPVVIQTHQWDAHKFWVDGPYSTAFAAQPLAGSGFLVVQLGEDVSQLGLLAEMPSAVRTYEHAIEYLATNGLIDRDRVGIIGFSRTGLHVKYALTHSKYHFAAATVADGSDGGYFAYLSYLNTPLHTDPEYESANGGSPFGKGLASWIRNSPGFGLNRVTAPIRLEANLPGSLFFCWEWFVGLQRLGRPTELIYIPDGNHVLIKPWNRLASQQGNVDWFNFWLNGHEDSDSAKAEQYRRWEKLCDLQRSENPGHRTFCVGSRN
jgi:dipeptidyl aminopeptidase/acylaminoacyl peptidase